MNNLQEKLFEECCAMISHAQKVGKNFPAHINVLTEVSFASKKMSDLQELHGELQALIAPALVENIVEQKPLFSMWLARFSLSVFIVGLVAFSICGVLHSFDRYSTKTMQHGLLLGAVFAANGLYLLFELKRFRESFALQQSVEATMWMRGAMGIFSSVFLVEAVFADAQIMQMPRFVPLLFVFSFPFAMFHCWDIVWASMKKLFFAADVSEDVYELLAKEIAVLHRYPANSDKARAQCDQIQKFLHRHNLLDDIDLLAEYAAEDTQEYLKLLLFTRFIATHENVPVVEESTEQTTCIDEIVDTHIQKTLYNLRKSNTKKQKNSKRKKSKSKKNNTSVEEIFEQEFVCIRDNKNVKSDNV
ncbi:hypothetical protein [Candidatus Uabimicrobium amorphum]|uniref:Uncharacterized protein n=1 Tax=Uabimicrobium amorphum TaxID=2596890 RepID=A0A5S9F7Q8_UABAM|nr:hypothetical protein [Candidatus Uabimicrobium amorphum]BBM87999.1 hypothetical protein UABAM_06415 [Candidatus Uabimicrobium amorphum]